MQATFVTKILITALDKLHVTLVTNDKKFWMKKKFNKIHFHLLTDHICIVTCNKDAIFLMNHRNK
jgi:hypothetical protein